ncbi:MAG: FtsL-like putative cell division protein [Flavobacteriales bacterium]|jgi:cell division protein FtsL|nr:FtsL-like putative cell division protein [Schleiferiaceae bacterium]|tara:strand:+ start:2053 stop:2376 length:324 start_codon:yes stop_codon:yes gene_type:complete
MSKLKKAIEAVTDRLKLTDEGLIRMLPFAAWLSALALFSIYVSHSTDRKVHEIDELSKLRQTLEAEHTETKERLTKLSLESRVLKRAQELDLINPDERPEKIVVESE